VPGQWPPLDSHGEFAPRPARDAVGLLLGQAASRVPELVPIRHGRMLCPRSPSTGRGAANGRGPGRHARLGASGAGVRGRPLVEFRRVRLAGSGTWSSTSTTSTRPLPGPFEWDVKRLAASLAVAGRDNGFPAKARRKIALAAAEGYRTAMRGFAEQHFLDVWYAHMDIEPALSEVRSQIKAKRLKAFEKMLAKAHTRDSTQALAKLTTEVDGQRRIISVPPTIVPVEEVSPICRPTRFTSRSAPWWTSTRRSLQSDRRHLLKEFTLVAGGPQGRRGWAASAPAPGSC